MFANATSFRMVILFYIAYLHHGSNVLVMRAYWHIVEHKKRLWIYQRIGSHSDHNHHIITRTSHLNTGNTPEIVRQRKCRIIHYNSGTQTGYGIFILAPITYIYIVIFTRSGRVPLIPGVARCQEYCKTGNKYDFQVFHPRRFVYINLAIFHSNSTGSTTNLMEDGSRETGDGRRKSEAREPYALRCPSVS